MISRRLEYNGTTMQSVILESAAVGCLLLAIAGCASRAPPGIATLAVEVPSEWSAADAAAKVGASSLVQWWLRFDDPLLGALSPRHCRPTRM